MTAYNTRRRIAARDFHAPLLYDRKRPEETTTLDLAPEIENTVREYAAEGGVSVNDLIARAFPPRRQQQTAAQGSPERPSLIVVTGRPGAGKTSLVHALARAIRCPAICRDELKEGLIHANGATAMELPSDAALKIYDAFFDTISLLLSRNISVVAEAAFQHKIWAPKLEPLAEAACVRVVVCDIDPELALSRRVGRGLTDTAREQFHPDALLQAVREGRDVTMESYEPPRLEVPTLIVDTSEGYQPPFEAIVSFARNR